MRMLGVAENRILGPADRILKRAADAAGVGDTFYRTQRRGLRAGRRARPAAGSIPTPTLAETARSALPASPAAAA